MKIGIIGVGNMGSAIAERIKFRYQVLVVDKDKTKATALHGVTVYQNISDLVFDSEVLLLAVKPQNLKGLLMDIKDLVGNKLILSIAAGINTSFIEAILGRVRVIRAMPNLAVRVGRGITCICLGAYAQNRDLQFGVRFFSFLGKVLVLEEEMMDAVTAVSGSGLGFWAFLVEHKDKKEWLSYTKKEFVPQLTIAAESLGFTKNTARLLAENTARGSLAMVKIEKISPQELKFQVASKGGTTEAGLEVLNNNGSLQEAVLAAFKRAKTLAQSLI